jgi:hypothetical protein
VTWYLDIAISNYREWPVPEEPKVDTKYGFGQKKKFKGHKHEKLAIERCPPAPLPYLP